MAKEQRSLHGEAKIATFSFIGVMGFPVVLVRLAGKCISFLLFPISKDGELNILKTDDGKNEDKPDQDPMGFKYFENGSPPIEISHQHGHHRGSLQLRFFANTVIIEDDMFRQAKTRVSAHLLWRLSSEVLQHCVGFSASPGGVKKDICSLPLPKGLRLVKLVPKVIKPQQVSWASSSWFHMVIKPQQVSSVSPKMICIGIWEHFGKYNPLRLRFIVNMAIIGATLQSLEKLCGKHHSKVLLDHIPATDRRRTFTQPPIIAGLLLGLQPLPDFCPATSRRWTSVGPLTSPDFCLATDHRQTFARPPNVVGLPSGHRPSLDFPLATNCRRTSARPPIIARLRSFRPPSPADCGLPDHHRSTRVLPTIVAHSDLCRPPTTILRTTIARLRSFQPPSPADYGSSYKARTLNFCHIMHSHIVYVT
ncbi:hypothetical protein M5K25_020243 [Dendrobium thyrsiflorum]|uniref:Uncharacterized protein n=1 Tax=Dendrobium thyrsiflorum TaxID=117978 RepID=A0ABD0UA22_DENTH